MRRMIVVFASFFLGCGGEEPIMNEPSKKCEERQVVTAKKAPVIIRAWLDSRKMLDENFVLNALNSYWREVGVAVVKADASDKADVGINYNYGSDCRRPVEFGRLNYSYWANMDSILVNYNCFDKVADYKEKFPATASHALGMLFGIESYPDFCSDGVMSERVGRMEDIMPTRLSAGDKEAFYHRSRFSTGWDYVQVCYEEPKWERGEYAPADFRTVKFWADPALAAVPIRDYLNQYFKVFGKNFEVVGEKDAEFVVKVWEKSYTGCSPTAITYNSLREIHLKLEHGCLALTPGSERDATIVSHEVAHLFGVSHVPEWCGNAIMQPNVNPGPYFTLVDVKAWQARDFSSSVLDE